jgi:hypothetical protein
MSDTSWAGDRDAGLGNRNSLLLYDKCCSSTIAADWPCRVFASHQRMIGSSSTRFPCRRTFDQKGGVVQPWLVPRPKVSGERLSLQLRLPDSGMHFCTLDVTGYLLRTASPIPPPRILGD